MEQYTHIDLHGLPREREGQPRDRGLRLQPLRRLGEDGARTLAPQRGLRASA